MGRPLAARKALYVTHMRDEGDRVMEALEETFRIGRELAVPVVVSHHKVQNVAEPRPHRGDAAPHPRRDEAPVHRRSTAIPTPPARP